LVKLSLRFLNADDSFGAAGADGVVAPLAGPATFAATNFAADAAARFVSMSGGPPAGAAGGDFVFAVFFFAPAADAPLAALSLFFALAMKKLLIFGDVPAANSMNHLSRANARHTKRSAIAFAALRYGCKTAGRFRLFLLDIFARRNGC
jgi:hypothetical protein